jgi:hypothetical protein
MLSPLAAEGFSIRTRRPSFGCILPRKKTSGSLFSSPGQSPFSVVTVVDISLAIATPVSTNPTAEDLDREGKASPTPNKQKADKHNSWLDLFITCLVSGSRLFY